MSLNHVLIAGGGIGGLCLAQGLHKAGISAAVYESTPGIVQSGYRLHMNATGGRALQQCLPEHLYELYLQTSRTNPRREAVVFLDSDARELGWRPHIGPPNGSDRPHTAVNRRTLRQIMYAGLETVQFNHTATGFTADSDCVRLHFADGTSAAGDLLVGADGINSVVRKQLLPGVPIIDTGRRGLAMRIPLTETLAAALPEAVFDGFAIVRGTDGLHCALGTYQPRRAVAEAVAELAPDACVDPVAPYLMAVLSFPSDSALLDDVADLWRASTSELYAVVRAAVRNWHPVLAEPFEQVDLTTLYAQSLRRLDPVEWSPNRRVTMLGDAIHAMPPNFGAGANSALRDAAALTDTISSIAAGGSDMLDAIADYEQQMRAEVFPILRASADPRALETNFLPVGVPVTGSRSIHTRLAITAPQ